MLRDTPPGENAALTGDPASPNPGDADWSKMARAAYEASTNWLRGSRRSGWADSLRMFQGNHPAGSKYLGVDYRYRSRLFRPKTRAMIRKTEATTAAAFFSNKRVATIEAENEDDPRQMASARLKQELINYRLEKSIPWFLICIGARQDCETYGICVSRQYWKYEERCIGVKRQPAMDEFGQPLLDDMGIAKQDEFQYFEVAADHPDIELIAPDNFRYDPACDWARPVESSPYLIQRIPMYVGKVKEKMEVDPATGKSEWKPYPDNAILSSKGIDDDTTRLTREHNRMSSMESQASSVRDFDIAWVHLNTIRWKGTDYVFFTLGPDKLLTEPRPHVEVYGTQKRPYRIGYTNLEAHRNYPASKIELTMPLQAQANDTANLRLDALKLSMQPRALVKSGSPAANSLADFRMFMPGKPILVNAMDDVQWDKPPDPSAASLAEQDRINADFDELSGTASQSLATTPGAANETLGGMEMLAGTAGSIGEYELRLFVETWVQGVIEDLVDLEERLEEDEVVLQFAGTKAKLYQQYTLDDETTNWMLSQKATTTIDVGIGATNPMTRLSQLKTGAEMLTSLFGPSVGAGLVWDEVCAEIFGGMGFAEGKRFFVEGFDPHQAQMQMEQSKANIIPGVDPTRMQQEQLKSQTSLQETEMKTSSQERIAAMKNTPQGVSFDPVKLHIEQFKGENDARIAAMNAESSERQAMIRLNQERLKQVAETQRATMEQQNALKGHVIRTLPAVHAKLLVAHHDRQSAERIARMSGSAS
jgi:hypothetical protein